MVSKNNSFITTRRKFLTLFVGTTLGFLTPFIKSINSAIAERPGLNLLISWVLPSGLTLLAYLGWESNKSNKQSKLSSTEFYFKIDDPPVGAYINLDIYIQDGRGNTLSERRLRQTISTRLKYWSYRYNWNGDGYDSPLYLSVVSDGYRVVKRFY
jgi:hypothetical protein